MKLGWVGVGLRMEFHAGDQWIITSHVRSIAIEHAPHCQPCYLITPTKRTNAAYGLRQHYVIPGGPPPPRPFSYDQPSEEAYIRLAEAFCEVLSSERSSSAPVLGIVIAVRVRRRA